MSDKKNLRPIRIGTCVPGPEAESWAPSLLDVGFETLSINFHMSYKDTDLLIQGPKLKDIAEEKGAEITVLGYYCNPLMNEDHRLNLIKAIDCAHLYGAKMVGTFAGAINGRPIDESFSRFGEVFRDLSKRAEDKGIRLVIENCPMGGTWTNAAYNIAINPKAWRAMFEEVPSEALGLQWEPGHQMIQLIDPIAQLRKWVHKIYHIHGKDASIDRRAIEDDGVFCSPDCYAPQRTPGFGDTDWRIILSILKQNAYDGDICVEGYHDPVYSGEWEMTAQKHSLNYLKWCRGGDFCPNPWS